MATLRQIERLFEQARLAPVPVFHVGDRVLAEIRARQGVELRPLSVLAGLSAAAAIVVLFYAVSGWLSWSGAQAADFFNPVVFEIW